MLHHPSVWRRFLTIALLLLLASGSLNVRAEEGLPAVIPPSDQQITRRIADLLKTEHFLRRKLDDEISRRCLRSFLKGLDPYKDVFLQSDIDEFMTQENNIDDMTNRGELSFVYQVFRRALTRYGERMAWIDELLAMPHDFGLEETWVVDFDLAAYPKDEAEAREKWRKRIKRDLLSEMTIDRESKEKDAADAAKAAKETEKEPPGVRDKEILPGDGGTPPLDEDDIAPEVVDDPPSRIRKRYQSLSRTLNQFDHYDLLDRFMMALAGAFDPHSVYMQPVEQDRFDISMKLELEGIGASLSSEDGYTVVRQIIKGGAADRDGRLKIGDKIVGVGQGETGMMVDVFGRKLADVVPMIRGERGTMVRLEVIPAGRLKKRLYVLTRDRVQLEDAAAKGEVFDHGNKADGTSYHVGVIELPSFYRDMTAAESGVQKFRSTTEDVRRILNGFLARGIDAVVLDLRGNPGGALNEAVELTGLFIDHGPVVQVRDIRIDQHSDRDRGALWNGPLVILTNKQSASASEILAGAIQDYKRGLIVGDHNTHGKGTVQRLYELPRDTDRKSTGVVKLTTQMFYRTSGASTQSRGVLADIVLPSIPSPGPSEAELDYALPWEEIAAVPFQRNDFVSEELIGKLRAMSGDRVKESSDFQKVLRYVEVFDKFKDRKEVTLNERAFLAERAELKQIEEIIDDEENQKDSAPKPGTTEVAEEKHSIPLDYYMKEALAITVDYVRLGSWQPKKDAM